MSQVKDERTVEVSRLLAGATQTIASVRYCWLSTAAETGVANARPMGRLASDLVEDDWTIRFITDRRSRKASEIRRVGKATVIFQDANDAFVTLVGPTTLLEEASEVRQRWKSAYDVYFPTDQDRANVALIEVDIQRMELWIRGLTPEPFGFRTTTVERDRRGAWRLTH
jgi:general stress protein 26